MLLEELSSDADFIEDLIDAFPEIGENMNLRYLKDPTVYKEALRIYRFAVDSGFKTLKPQVEAIMFLKASSSMKTATNSLDKMDEVQMLHHSEALRDMYDALGQPLPLQKFTATRPAVIAYTWGVYNCLYVLCRIGQYAQDPSGDEYRHVMCKAAAKKLGITPATFL